jgi:hypothetical protein
MSLREEGKGLLSHCASLRKRNVYQSSVRWPCDCRGSGCVFAEARQVAAVCEAPMYLCKSEKSFQQMKFR